MMELYDREGNSITMMQWARLSELPGYKRIAYTTLEDGRYISTVWLGLDHQYSDGPPLIFETMVFSVETHEVSMFPGREFHEEQGQWRWSTETQALAGHEAVVAALRGSVTVEQLIRE